MSRISRRTFRAHRPLSEDEKRPGRYLHLFDKNSQYLAASTGTSLGEGAPDYTDGYCLEDLDPHVPGLYQATLFPSTFNLWRIRNYMDRNWFWGPELHYLKQQGYVLSTGACYTWRKGLYHETLRSWGEALWNGRQALRSTRKPTFVNGCMATGSKYAVEPAREAAYSAVKLIATQGLGWLAHAPEHGTAQFYRPDFWNMIVSNAVAKLEWKIKQLLAANISVAYCDVDTLGAISDASDPVQAFPCFYERADALGGFKHTATLYVDSDLVDHFEDASRKGHTALHKYILSQEYKEMSHAV